MSVSLSANPLDLDCLVLLCLLHTNPLNCTGHRVPKNELDPTQPQSDPQGLLGPNDGTESDATAQARRHQASLYEQQQYEQLQFDLAQNSAVHAHLQQQQQRMLSGQGGMQANGALLPGQPRMVGGYNGLGGPADGGLGGVPGAVAVPTTKESRTRLADGGSELSRCCTSITC